MNGELKTGETAPDFTLPAAKGESVSLREVLDGGRRVLLVFLRHLG